MKTLFVLAFLLCISVGFAIKCDTCGSTTSMDDCDKKKMDETACIAGMDRCFTTSFKYTAEPVTPAIFAKGCANEASCKVFEKTDEACKKGKDAECSFDCCTEDMCNGGSAPVVSALLMVACAFMVFFR